MWILVIKSKEFFDDEFMLPSIKKKQIKCNRTEPVMQEQITSNV